MSLTRRAARRTRGSYPSSTPKAAAVGWCPRERGPTESGEVKLRGVFSARLFEEVTHMARWKADPTFYASPRLAMSAPRESLAYVAVFNPNKDGAPDAMTVVDVAPDSSTYGQLVGKTEMPTAGDELHHFGWNACSSALCPYAPHPHVERRYLIVPGLRSSRIHVLDTKPDPHQPKLVKVIEPAELAQKTGYSRPHTSHCGPDGIYMSALGAPSG